MNNGRAGKERGFTLLEALVAFAVVSLAFAIVLPLLLDAGKGANDANNSRLAILIAKSRLAEIGHERPLKAGNWTGEDYGFSWTLWIRDNPVLPADNAYAMAGYDIVFVIAPVGADAKRAIELKTMRLGPRG